MVKREIERIKEKYGRLFEPFQVLLLILLFVVPVVAVINLSPQTGNQQVPDDNILGVTTSTKPDIAEVGGSHQFIINERLTTDDEIVYLYQATVTRRDPGVYSKPMITITNPSEKTIIARFLLKNGEPSSSQIGIMADSFNYVIKENTGESFIREFEMEPGEEKVFYLDVRNDEKMNFEENIDIRIDTRYEDDTLFFETENDFEGEIIEEEPTEGSEEVEIDELNEEELPDEGQEDLLDEETAPELDEESENGSEEESEETDAIIEIAD